MKVLRDGDPAVTAGMPGVSRREGQPLDHGAPVAVLKTMADSTDGIEPTPEGRS